MLLTEKLQTAIFSSSEQIVIDYLLQQRHLIADKTIKEIAKATYTSPSILIRISKKLGYTGWIPLKKDLLHEINYLDNHFQNIDANFPFSALDTQTQIANKVGTLIQETITDSLELLTHDDLAQAIRLIEKASHIKIFATSINNYLAKDFAYKMNRINKTVTIASLEGEQAVEATNMTPKDLAFIISYSGENEALTSILPLFKKHAIPLLTLTNMGENTISKAANCPLKLSTREKLYSKISGFSSHYSICFILDILYSCLFSLNYEQNFDHSTAISKMSDPRFSHLDLLREDETK